mmetsp:Transcript_3086/g.6339  ORF Transcript_3086/g.6339 Transcript_3086/m.6339 type:complete len:96 (-) Transcript_3086:405-692(-)
MQMGTSSATTAVQVSNGNLLALLPELDYRQHAESNHDQTDTPHIEARRLEALHLPLGPKEDRKKWKERCQLPSYQPPTPSNWLFLKPLEQAWGEI